jgi:ribonucleoside-diphosphate reductase alpha chain
VVNKDVFITALEMTVDEHVDILSAIAYHVDMSCSKTINVPSNYSFEDTKKIYEKCHDLGIKGCTIFRPNEIRQGIMITESSSNKNEENKYDSQSELPRGYIIKADDNCIGLKRTLHTGCGSLHCEAFFDPDNGQLLETYFSKGSSGGCNNFMIGLSRMISLAARGGVDIHSIIDQLNSCGTCPSYAVRAATKKDTSKGSCCPVAIGNALLDMYNAMQTEIGSDEEYEGECKEYEFLGEYNDGEITNPCPQCGEELTFEGGCNICKSCGWSKCG